MEGGIKLKLSIHLLPRLPAWTRIAKNLTPEFTEEFKAGRLRLSAGYVR
jgi:hypothetical protein